jgi:hypothetical protein
MAIPLRYIATGEGSVRRKERKETHMPMWGTVSNCECACSGKREFRATFLIKPEGIKCSNCGRTRSCKPPIMDVVHAECGCTGRGEDTTFVVDSEGTYVCTNCGRTK